MIQKLKLFFLELSSYLSDPLLSKDTYIGELHNSTLSIVAGLVFIFSSVFHADIYGRRPDIYLYMNWASPWIWGLLFLSAGLIHYITLYKGFKSRRKVILLIKSFLWLYVGFCILSGDEFALSGWFCIVFSVFAMFSFLKIQKLSDSSLTNVHTSSNASTSV